MSTLKVTDIQSNGTGFNDVVSFQNASGTENGKLCRAFVNFDGTTGSGVGFSDITIRAAFNVSSITDNGVGDYRLTFTNALEDTNYVVLSTAGPGPGNFATSGDPVSTTTADVGLRISNTGAALDASIYSAAIFR